MSGAMLRHPESLSNLAEDFDLLQALLRGLSCATIKMNLEDIVISEMSQAQKEKCACFRLCEASKVIERLETGSRKLVARGERGRKGEGGEWVRFVLQHEESPEGLLHNDARFVNDTAMHTYKL